MVFVNNDGMFVSAKMCMFRENNFGSSLCDKESAYNHLFFN